MIGYRSSYEAVVMSSNLPLSSVAVELTHAQVENTPLASNLLLYQDSRSK